MPRTKENKEVVAENVSGKANTPIKNEKDTKIISRKEARKQRKLENEKPASEEPKEKTEEELEEEALARYNQAQAMKGREPPPFVHLQNSEKKRKTMGNDIKIENYTLQVPKRTLLIDANLTLAFGHRYGLVGRNGLGKSCLLRQISLEKDRNEKERDIKIADHLRVLYVDQEAPGDEDVPLEHVLRADVERAWLVQEERAILHLELTDPDWMDNPDEKRCYGLREIQERLQEIESEKAIVRASRILVGLGFDDKEITSKPAREYSGGWRMRIALASALFCRPDVLLLDEPTNHLDLHACIWLEKYLSSWKSTLLVVSHEATFLNEVVDRIIELRHKKLTTYKGNYWSYMEARQIEERTMQKKLKKGEKMELAREDPSLKINIPNPDPIPVSIIEFHEVSFGYSDENPIFSQLEFGIDMNSRVALVGLNGVGKSTLMKLMLGDLKETAGYVNRNRQSRVARFSQHSLEQLNINETPIEYLNNKFKPDSIHQARGILGRFGITGTLATQKIETLSGGQKSRVVLAEMAWTHPHVLLLDEPSNHLDLDAIEALANGLKNFTGGVVLISHNQRLISLVCKEIWVVTKAGTVDRFNGEFEDYKSDIIAHMDFGGEKEDNNNNNNK